MKMQLLFQLIFVVICSSPSNGANILIKDTTGSYYAIAQFTRGVSYDWTVSVLVTKKYDQVSEGTTPPSDATGQTSVTVASNSIWSSHKYCELQFIGLTTQIDLQNPDIRQLAIQNYWLKAKITDHSLQFLADETCSFKLQIQGQISFAIKKPSRLEFDGLETTNSCIKILSIEKDQMAEYARIFQNELTPILELTDTDDKTKNVLIESTRIPPIFVNMVLILIKCYDVIKKTENSINYRINADVSKILTTSNCYLSFGTFGAIKYGVGKINFEKTTASGTLWLEGLWSTSSSTYESTKKVKIEFKDISPIQVAVRDSETKEPESFLDKKKFIGIYPALGSFTIDPMTAQVVMDFNFGKIATLVFQLGDKVTKLTGHYNETFKVLTLIGENLLTFKTILEANIKQNQNEPKKISDYFKRQRQLQVNIEADVYDLPANSETSSTMPTLRMSISDSIILNVEKDNAISCPICQISYCVCT